MNSIVRELLEIHASLQEYHNKKAAAVEANRLEFGQETNWENSLRFDVILSGAGKLWTLFKNVSGYVAADSIFVWSYELDERPEGFSLLIFPTELAAKHVPIDYDLSSGTPVCLNPFLAIAEEVKARHRSQKPKPVGRR